MNLTRGYTLEWFKKELTNCGFFPVDVISTEDVLVLRHPNFIRHQSLDEWIEYLDRIKLKKEDEEAQENSDQHPQSLPLSNP